MDRTLLTTLLVGPPGPCRASSYFMELVEILVSRMAFRRNGHAQGGRLEGESALSVMAMTRGKPRFGPAKKICGKSLRAPGRWDNFLAWAITLMENKEKARSMKNMDTTTAGLKPVLDLCAGKINEARKKAGAQPLQFHSGEVMKMAICKFWLDMMEVQKPEERAKLATQFMATPGWFGSNASAARQAYAAKAGALGAIENSYAGI
jgi:hypothetical protein